MYSVCQNCKGTVNKQKIEYYFDKCVKIRNGNENSIKIKYQYEQETSFRSEEKFLKKKEGR